MDKLIYSVHEIFSDFLPQEQIEYYNIPEYQRGYKWNKANLIVLLDDIEKFRKETDGTPPTFYCLQNITLTKNTEKNCFDVVDGQQRLTTLLILLSFLQSITNNQVLHLENKLYYSVRLETHQFIQEHIFTGNIWNSEITPQHKDQYYICQVAKGIQEWFSHKKETEKKMFLSILLSSVKLIVNIVSDKAEKIFSSLNSGKISLDGADLLRATLMTRAAKEKFHETATTSEIREFRIRMGMELDMMNIWFKETGNYFRQFVSNNTSEMAQSNRFDYQSLPINLLYLLYYEYRKNGQEPLNFSFFEYGKNLNDTPKDDRWEMYVELQEMYATLQSWYHDRELYHYLGFLFFNFKSQTPFSYIYAKWKELNSREGFLRHIQQLIATRMLENYEEDNNGPTNYPERLKKMTEAISDVKGDWYNNDTELYHILILMDIFRILETKTIKKIPADYLTRKTGQKDGEDKEHILPQTPLNNNREISNTKADWEKFIQMENFCTICPQIQEILGNSTEEKLTEAEIITLQYLLNPVGLNSIGNIVLLDLRINRSYGNADYLRKRTIIFQEYMNQKYVRPHTLAVFMKGDIDAREATEIPLDKWNLEDIKRNTDKIAREIENHFHDWLNFDN